MSKAPNIKKLINDKPLWDNVQELVEQLIEKDLDEMSKSKDTWRISQLQGSVQAHKNILKWRDHYND